MLSRFCEQCADRNVAHQNDVGEAGPGELGVRGRGRWEAEGEFHRERLPRGQPQQETQVHRPVSTYFSLLHLSEAKIPADAQETDVSDRFSW